MVCELLYMVHLTCSQYLFSILKCRQKGSILVHIIEHRIVVGHTYNITSWLQLEGNIALRGYQSEPKAYLKKKSRVYSVSMNLYSSE